ncbi:MAG: hypothetical protein HQ507_00590 [Candidatus Marinimicrobia bacterium]|nr:hypothetical protein [Candidatus Neomarinimicrobiota bacterium]
MYLETPTNKLVGKYIRQFNKDERYFAADSAIVNLFDAFPGNKKLEDILLKISVINDLYSTNIFGTFNMAKHIQSLKVDSAIRRGDLGIVHKIATGHGIKTKKYKKEINFYSFATKYCNWHNRDNYAIYDTFVHKILVAYKKRDDFSDFEEKDLKDFKSFKNIIQDYINFYKLTQHNLKEIDKFLWIYGKEMFPPNY